MSPLFSKTYGSRPYIIMCALFFVVFTFSYLFCYQDNLLAMMQHILSNGQTHYNRLIGAIIITSLLMLLQLVLYVVTHLNGRLHILTYVPSIVLLTTLTAVDGNYTIGITIGKWWWIAPLIIILDAIALFYARQLQDYDSSEGEFGFFSRTSWINYCGLTALFMLVMFGANHQRVLHMRLDVEQCIASQNYKKATATYARALQTDSSLTNLRVYALSLSGQLPERLFEYALVGGSAVMLPSNSNVHYLLCGQAPLYQHLGGMFRQKMSTMHYLRFIHQHHLATKAAHDYLLCAYLMDGNLDLFVHAIGKYYDLKKPLPKHYREALVLYNHLRSNPYVVYHNSVMEADFTDFQTLIKQYNDARQRIAAIRDTYGNTYWAYYYQLKH